MKTAEDFEKVVKERGMTYWNLRECSICDAPYGYIFRDGKVWFDSSCDCASSFPEPRSYQDIADHYNMQTHPDVIKELNEEWGFKD